MTSDRFFNERATGIYRNGLDIVLVDGLHTYDQALRDVQNALKYLNENGLIVMHDCNPASSLSAYPVKKSMDELKVAKRKNPQLDWPGAWNGDVWKALWHLRCTHPELTIFTLKCDHGLGIVLKKAVNIEPIETDISDVEMILEADYQFLDAHRRRILNLKSPEYFYDVLKAFD
jgi:hypothetical protein